MGASAASAASAPAQQQNSPVGCTGMQQPEAKKGWNSLWR